MKNKYRPGPAPGETTGSCGRSEVFEDEDTIQLQLHEQDRWIVQLKYNQVNFYFVARTTLNFGINTTHIHFHSTRTGMRAEMQRERNSNFMILLVLVTLPWTTTAPVF